VLANDSDIDDEDDPTVTGVDATSANGAAISINPDDTINYDPSGVLDWLDEGDTLNDTFSYTINDGHGGSATGLVTVSVTGVNDDPVAKADTTATDEDTAIAVNVLGNDTDPDADDVLSVKSVDAASANGVPLSINPDGTIAYDPTIVLSHMDQGDSLDDSFSYVMKDSQGVTSSFIPR